MGGGVETLAGKSAGTALCVLFDQRDRSIQRLFTESERFRQAEQQIFPMLESQEFIDIDRTVFRQDL